MTPRQAAKIIGISIRQVCHLCATGVIKAVVKENEYEQEVWYITKAQAIKARDDRPKPGKPKGE